MLERGWVVGGGVGGWGGDKLPTALILPTIITKTKITTKMTGREIEQETPTHVPTVSISTYPQQPTFEVQEESPDDVPHVICLIGR